MEVSGFVNQIIEAANEAKCEPIVKIVERFRVCLMCKKATDEDHCPDCQNAIERGHQISYLAGRCRTGSDQQGIRWHALPIKDGYPSSRALCGYAPRGLSAGWSQDHPDGRKVTCPTCLRKLPNPSNAPTGKRIGL